MFDKQTNRHRGKFVSLLRSCRFCSPAKAARPAPFSTFGRPTDRPTRGQPRSWRGQRRFMSVAVVSFACGMSNIDYRLLLGQMWRAPLQECAADSRRPPWPPGERVALIVLDAAAAARSSACLADWLALLWRAHARPERVVAQRARIHHSRAHSTTQRATDLAARY